MARLLIHVEGETEETVVNEVLSGHLYRAGYDLVSARIVGNARLRSRRGGIRAWSAVRRDILSHLREDPGCMATTMVDYYALPQTGPRAWPGREAAGALPFARKAALILAAVEYAQRRLITIGGRSRCHCAATPGRKNCGNRTA